MGQLHHDSSSWLFRLREDAPKQMIFNVQYMFGPYFAVSFAAEHIVLAGLETATSFPCNPSSCVTDGRYYSV